MTKSILLTVSPTEALNVLNGKQLALLRKRVPKGYVGWCYGVVSGKKPRLFYQNGYNHSWILENSNMGIIYDKDFDELANGKAPFRFWYEEVSTLEYHKRNDVLMWDDNYYYYTKDNVYNNVECILDELQLEHQEVLDYSNGKDLYAISITKLEVFDKPMDLKEFYSIKPMVLHTPDCIDYKWYPEHDAWLKYAKTPSTYQYVWVKE